MNYAFQYNVVWPAWPELLSGAMLTFELGVLAFWGGALIGLVGAAIETYGARPLRWLVDGYVTFFTNTPALVQIFFLYFGLPEVGLRWSSYTCVLLGLTLNAGAYLTIIMRAGFLSVRRTELEAGLTLGMSLVQLIRYVIVPHIAKTIYPALANFFTVILILGTPVGMVIGLNDLLGTAYSLSTVNYRFLEFLSVTAVIYVVIGLFGDVLLAAVGRWAFRVKTRVF